MSRAAANPEREAINTKLDALRAEQSALFTKQRKVSLTPKEQARLTELGRTELALMAAKRDTGRRVIGARHHKR